MGSKLLAGMGPKVAVKFLDTGTVETTVRSEFKSAGINQTIHRIYLDVTCNVSVLTPYRTTDTSIKNEIMIAENVIVGTVPSTYYNLEGMQTSNLIDVVE